MTEITVLFSYICFLWDTIWENKSNCLDRSTFISSHGAKFFGGNLKQMAVIYGSLYGHLYSVFNCCENYIEFQIDIS